MDEVMQAINALDDKMMLIDSNVKFNFTVYWSVIAIVIAVIGIINWIVIKKYLEQKAQQYIEKRLENIISNIQSYKTICGKKYLHESELKDGYYSFEIGSEKLNIIFKKSSNNIEIKPIQGEGELDFIAKVINGKLSIKFKNFIPQTQKGIEWKIVYLDN